MEEARTVGFPPKCTKAMVRARDETSKETNRKLFTILRALTLHKPSASLLRSSLLCFAETPNLIAHPLAKNLYHEARAAQLYPNQP